MIIFHFHRFLPTTVITYAVKSLGNDAIPDDGAKPMDYILETSMESEEPDNVIRNPYLQPDYPWRAYKDPKSGKISYWNCETQDSVWNLEDTDRHAFLQEVL